MNKDYLDGFEYAVNAIATKFAEEIKNTEDEDKKLTLRNAWFNALNSVKLNVKEKMHEKD